MNLHAYSYSTNEHVEKVIDLMFVRDKFIRKLKF